MTCSDASGPTSVDVGKRTWAGISTDVPLSGSAFDIVELCHSCPKSVNHSQLQFRLAESTASQAVSLLGATMLTAGQGPVRARPGRDWREAIDIRGAAPGRSCAPRNGR